MFEQGVSDKIEEVKEPQVKDVADIMKRYLESQQELMVRRKDNKLGND